MLKEKAPYVHFTYRLDDVSNTSPATPVLDPDPYQKKVFNMVPLESYTTAKEQPLPGKSIDYVLTS